MSKTIKLFGKSDWMKWLIYDFSAGRSLRGKTLRRKNDPFWCATQNNSVILWFATENLLKLFAFASKKTLLFLTGLKTSLEPKKVLLYTLWFFYNHR